MTAIITEFEQENHEQARASRDMQRCKDELVVRERRLREAQEAEGNAHDSYRPFYERDEHHAPLPRQWAIAGLALIPEWYACYLGAEALGQGIVPTALFATIILTVLGGCEYWYDSAVRTHNPGQKRLALTLLVATIVALGGLRFYYGWLVEGRSLLGGLGLAAALTIVTAALVGIGCAALRFSESISTWQKRKEHEKAQQAMRSAETALAQARDDESRATRLFSRLVMRDITNAAHRKHLSEERLKQALSRYISRFDAVQVSRETHPESTRP